MFSSLYQLIRATTLGLCIPSITQPLVHAETVAIPKKQSSNQDPVYLDSDFLTKITLLQWTYSPSFPVTYECLYHFETKMDILNSSSMFLVKWVARVFHTLSRLDLGFKSSLNMRKSKQESTADHQGLQIQLFVEKICFFKHSRFLFCITSQSCFIFAQMIPVYFLLMQEPSWPLQPTASASFLLSF